MLKSLPLVDHFRGQANIGCTRVAWRLEIRPHGDGPLGHRRRLGKVWIPSGFRPLHEPRGAPPGTAEPAPSGLPGRTIRICKLLLAYLQYCRPSPRNRCRKRRPCRHATGPRLSLSRAGEGRGEGRPVPMRMVSVPPRNPHPSLRGAGAVSLPTPLRPA